jgi:predicted glycogen debranching enzyme
MTFTNEEFLSFEEGIKKEWMLTNGIGGFAGSTLINSNTRRYHGLLVAALNPPVNRHLVVSNINEIVETDRETSYLSSFECSGNYITEGFHHITYFNNDTIPTWIYRTNALEFTKEIWMVYGQNTTIVRYHIKNYSKNSKVTLYPLVNFRDYHGERTDFSPFEVVLHENCTEVKFDKTIPVKLKMIGDGAEFFPKTDLFFGMAYRKERERGLTDHENQYMPGFFEVNLKPNEEKRVDIIFTVEEDINIDINKSYKEARERGDKLVKKAGYKDPFVNALVKASDAFIVDRNSTNGKTIIAGYPWFTDWGRDTLIALTGLTISTKRYNDAKSILNTFMRYIKDGLLPNVFPDFGEKPGYNTVDASLWFFEAVYNYYKATKDDKFLKVVYPKLEEIFNRYRMTKEEIEKIDTEIVYSCEDNLIYQGNEHTQLTWMDAKVGDFVVTPRFGKAVEINALWYNAVMIMADLSSKVKKEDKYSSLARKIKKSFVTTFWYEKGQYLYDVVNENGTDTSIRPNQIFAIALNFPVITDSKAKKIFMNVAENLYTPVGLRSLAPTDDKYRSVYLGDIWNRDTAYHQGIVWTWPLGAFITAGKRLKIKDKRFTTKQIIENIKYTLKEETLGQINEIFDAEPPFTPRGCYAQAWSVGEILRAITE